MPHTTTKRLPVHPGDILLHDFLEPMGITQYRVSKECGLAPRHVNEIVKRIRGITAPTALAFGKFFGVDPQWWMNMQSHYELEVALRSAAVAKKVSRIKSLPLAA